MKTSNRGKLVGGGWRTLGLPFVFLLCLCFFLAGFFGSSLFSQQDEGFMRARSRMLESVDTWRDFDPLPHGETGEDSMSLIPFQVLSWYPRALYFPNFATAEQCESIVKMAKKQLKPSSLALRKGETAENTKGIRTSSGTFISASEDKTGTLDLIEEKIAKVTMIPRSHGEAFNVLRYEIGQSYHSHYDAFNPAEYGPQKSQRVASFLLYLSDVEEGGETMFPFEYGQNMDGNYDFRRCEGLKVKPRKGDGLLFYSLLLNGTIDPTSLHGSCPVIKGQKWVATKWIRDQEQDD
ncbi:PREDICTED: probable prolyl 4-hydroxylase 9 [Ipomoea nil]|uniref:probable prolyl 4-hydroxylase 9 n=1 Tax=Ipomoea nil TaxID=35883 RepID=UPI000901BE90|nr:PREDICTED: probable prolyl 4-hydroxylase 9 [Ipomoea nil]